MSAAIDRFERIAREFCGWIETGVVDGADAVTAARRHLARLHAAALDLPEVERLYWPGPPDGVEEDKEYSAAVLARLKEFPMKYYRIVSSTLSDEAPTVGDVTDDLLDTWRDVSIGLATFESGDRELAATLWRASFEYHWARHSVEALMALLDFDPETAKIRS